MEIEECREIHLDPEARDCTDDNKFSAFNAGQEVDLGIDDLDLLHDLHQSMEAERTQSRGRYNLRKSLAWDSAFFTSAGVLDAEELSSMITGADKSKKKLLPGIQEDITASTESISSLESDHFDLETLEEELFVDIRASIQRSNKKLPNLSRLSDKKANVEVDSSSISSLKNEGVTPRSQDKNSKPRSKGTSAPETATMPKSLVKQNVQRQALRTGIKQDSGHSQMLSVAKTGDKKVTLGKTPRNIIKPVTNPATVQRDSMGIGRGKSECGSSKLGAPVTTTSKGTQLPKVAVSAGRMLPRPAVSSKTCLKNSSTSGRGQSTRSSTSSNSSNGLSSGAASKLLPARRNPGGSSSKTVTGPGSIPKTLTRTAVQNKPPSSTTKVSSSVSSGSSIGDWSSVSSSSSSLAIRKFNNTKASVEISSSKSTDGRSTQPLHSKNPSADPTTGGHENSKVHMANGISNKTTTSVVQSLGKPTGLRMPSPKIGFFDGVKSSPRTPNDHKPTQPGLRAMLPRNGVAASSPGLTSNSKAKSVKTPTSRMSASSASSKPDSAKATSLKQSHDWVNSSVPSDGKDSCSLSVGIKGNDYVKAEKVQVDDYVKQMVDADADADVVVEGNLGDFNIDEFMVPEDIPGLHDVLPVTGCPSEISNGKLKDSKAPTTGMSAPLAPDSLEVVTSHSSFQEKSVSSSPVGVEGNGTVKEYQHEEKIQVDDGGVKQVDGAAAAAVSPRQISNGLLKGGSEHSLDSCVLLDIKDSSSLFIENDKGNQHEEECRNSKTFLLDNEMTKQDGIVKGSGEVADSESIAIGKDQSLIQSCYAAAATEKENSHNENQGEGVTESNKKDCSPLNPKNNEDSCEELRSPLALKNEGPEEFRLDSSSSLVGDERTSAREPLM
ncbi:uncharacterized protein LOC127239566 isoform X2 [Andrographis paniculata]|uniref:uncharacterized protein LOC127239566 isoform X2 n=1 Tax=Andrographis paniculata TaxID=175694 RepID=UPI0021E874FA|nr:uncharacterized protein LOC127239566 isoform X2 [Andrographis paniculata]